MFKDWWHEEPAEETQVERQGWTRPETECGWDLGPGKHLRAQSYRCLTCNWPRRGFVLFTPLVPAWNKFCPERKCRNTSLHLTVWPLSHLSSMLVTSLILVGKRMIHFTSHPQSIQNWSWKGKISVHEEQRKGFKRFPVNQTRITRVNTKLPDSYFRWDTQQPGASCSVSSDCLANFSPATRSKFMEVGNRKSECFPYRKEPWYF